MRKIGRVDVNQKEIVLALRRVGCSVLILSNVGGGCPDICVGYKGINYLFEIKDGTKTPSQRKLTPDEKKFFDTWEGHCNIVGSVKDCMDILQEK
jgi:Holliday junction resolvase|tara:strand:+ start:341 stop:625 length:285 start_codon:yes stop_codon:yes gene_type:complete